MTEVLQLNEGYSFYLAFSLLTGAGHKLTNIMFVEPAI